MKARQRRPVAGPTTGWRTNQASCIEEKQRCRQPVVRNTPENTSIHAGMYDCMRSESESELGNHLSGILRKTNKQTNVPVCLCMYVCMRSESESASHSSPPQLTGVRVISTFVCACVCAGTTSLISLLCLFICRCTLWHKNTHTHTQATLQTKANTFQVIIENQHFHSSTASQYSATRHTHTHRSDESPAKMSGGRTDNWLPHKPRPLYPGETES